MSLLNHVVVTIHGVYALIGISLNCVLLYCMHRYTPANFRVFGMLMKIHTIFDLFGTLASFCAMQRIIPCDWSLLYISYGPCRYLGGPITCYICYTLSLFVYVVTFYITLVSFMARLQIIKHGSITALRTVILLVCIATPAPLTFAVSFLISKSDDELMKGIMRDNYPNDSNYDTNDHIVTGNADLRTIPMFNVMFIVTILITPLYAVILTIRSAILRIVNKANLKMSSKTKTMHRQFVHMLTLQAALPLILIFAVITFCLGQFHIIKHPAIESASIIIGETPSLISPVIVFFHIPAYRRAVKSFITGRNSAPSEVSNQNSQEHGPYKSTVITVRSTRSP